MRCSIESWKLRVKERILLGVCVLVRNVGAADEGYLVELSDGVVVGWQNSPQV